MRSTSTAWFLTALVAFASVPIFLQGAEAAVTPGFVNYAAPTSLFNYNEAAEPSVGVNWNTGAIMFQSYTSTYRIDLGTTPPTWDEVTPPNSIINVDPILFTDSVSGRTFAGGLDGYCSVLSYTDTDGLGVAAWTPVTNSCAGAGWDHQTVGGGAYAAPLTGVGYPNAVWYCSQTGLSPGPAWCALSTNGGLSFNGGTQTWATECWGLHGHIKVGPDGYAYLPDRDCGSVQGGGVTSNNGLTWRVFRVPGIAPTEEFDPSVAVGGTAAANKVYFCGRDGNGHAKVAVSSDHATTWSTPVDVGASHNLQNIEFPAMVAGDADRAACAYLGTTTAGDTQKGTFAGVWHLYVSTTYDAGQTWSTVQVSQDPVQKGCIWAGGGSNSCRNLLDFNDAAITKEGNVVVAYADGCTGTCATGGAVTKTAWATIAVQTSGTPLFAGTTEPCAPCAPDAPTLSASAGDRSVALTWTTPPNGGAAITGYKVYRNGAFLASVGVTNTYTDSSVTNGATYSYQVSAVNSVGEGAKSNTVSATPVANTVPNAPTGLTASHSGGPKSGKIALSWQAPAANGGPAVTGYKIYRGTTSGGETLLTSVGNVLSYTDTGLTQGSTYYYKVAAVNTVGTGPQSNEASALG